MRSSSLAFIGMRGACHLGLTLLGLASCATQSEQPASSRGSGGATPSSAGSGGAGGPGDAAGSGGAPGSGGAVMSAPADAGGDGVAATDGPAASDGPAPSTSTRVLLYTYRTGYRHTSAVPASQVLRDKLAAMGFTSDIVDADNNLFTDENLARYRLVVMVQSSGSPVGMGDAELNALTKFVRNGGALAGFHAATDVAYPPEHPYVALMGGKFIGHPGGIRAATCTPVAGAQHPAIAKIPAPFMQTDEIYTYSGLNPDNQVILRCSSSDGGPPVPITWYRTEGAGRIFYTGLGHVDGLWTADSTFVNNHFFPGVLWTIGR